MLLFPCFFWMEQNGAEVAMRPCGCVEHSWVSDHIGGHGGGLHVLFTAEGNCENR